MQPLCGLDEDNHPHPPQKKGGMLSTSFHCDQDLQACNQAIGPEALGRTQCILVIAHHLLGTPESSKSQSLLLLRKFSELKPLSYTSCESSYQGAPSHMWSGPHQVTSRADRTCELQIKGCL